MPRLTSRALAWLCLAILPGWSSLAAQTAPGPPVNTDLPAVIDEASGLALSTREGELLWTHNDNINDPGSMERVTPYVFGISPSGDLRVQLRLEGVTQRDWESIDAARIDNREMLIVADTGDNRASWPDYVLWFIPEASPATQGKEVEASPDALLRYRYPDGPADTESMVFDPRTNRILLLTKREDPPRMFSLPADARQPFPAEPGLSDRRRLESAPVEIADPVGTMARLQPTDPINWLLLPLTGSQTNRPTGMALSPDGSTLAVLTYASLYFFHRGARSDWSEAITRPVTSRSLPRIDQWEGLAFSADGRHLYVVREGTGPDTLLRLEVPEGARSGQP
ncbi:hypothetical protein [Guyparkeria sp.]|uniref:hypothetical protein n=1 Tax=Guyparkeria sp. TaxID=2035736 RepID=UPI003970FE12